jgi:hypothetical protein
MQAGHIIGQAPHDVSPYLLMPNPSVFRIRHEKIINDQKEFRSGDELSIR